MGRRYFVAVTLMAFCLGVSQGPGPGPGKDGQSPKNQASSGPKKGTTQNVSSPPSTSQVAPGSDTNASGHSDKSAGENPKPTPDGWTIFTAVGPVVIGLVTLIFMWRQVKIMRDMNDLTKIAADAANKSAIVAEKTLTLAQGPWMSLTGLKLVSNLASGEPWTLDGQVENFGVTPGIIRRWDIVWAILDTVPDQVSTTESVAKDNGLCYVKAGGGTLRQFHMNPLPDGAVERLNSIETKPNPDQLYIFCVVGYSDLFGGHHILTEVQGWNPAQRRFESVATNTQRGQAK